MPRFVRFRSRALGVVLACSALLNIAPASSAQEVQVGATREAFTALLDGLETSAHSGRVEALRLRLGALDDESWLKLGQYLELVPGAVEIPRVLERSRHHASTREAFLRQRGIEGGAGDLPAGSPADLERFRGEFVFFLDQLAQLGPMMAPAFSQRLAQSRAAIEAIPNDRLADFAQAYMMRMVELEQSGALALPLSATAPGQAATLPDDVMSIASDASFSCPSFSCNVSFTIPDSCTEIVKVKVCLSDIVGNLSYSFDLCDLTGLDDLLSSVCNTAVGFVEDINDFVNDTGTFFVGIVNEVGQGVEDVLDTIAGLPNEALLLGEQILDSIAMTIEDFIETYVPTTGDEFLDLLADAGLDVRTEGWWQGIQVPNLAPSCPAPGTHLPILGEVGTPRSELICRRIDAVALDLFDLTPDDVPALLVKLGSGKIYFPINYLCNCLQEAAQLDYFNRTLAFQALAAQRIDVDVSTRASGASLGVARGNVSEVQEVVDETDATLDRVQSKLGLLNLDIGDQTAFVNALEELLDRLDIERRLLADGDDDEGGDLLTPTPETLAAVRPIVLDTMTGLLGAGQSIRNAQKHLDKADRDRDRGRWKHALDNYRKAYLEATRATGGKSDD